MVRDWHSEQNSWFWRGLLLLLPLEVLSISFKRMYFWKHVVNWSYPSSKYVCSTAQSLRLCNMCGTTQHSPAPTQNSCWWSTNSSIYNSLPVRATMFNRSTWAIFLGYFTFVLPELQAGAAQQEGSPKTTTETAHSCSFKDQTLACILWKVF